MHLFELPVDVFRTLFDTAIFEWGLWHAVRYRLVNKLFDEQIRSTICRTRYLEQYPFPTHTRAGPNVELRQQYLEHVINIGNPGGLKLAQAITDIAEALEQHDDHLPTKSRKERLALLTAAGIGLCSPTKGLWLSVDPDRDDPHRKHREGLTTVNNCLIGAIVCEEMHLHLDLLQNREQLSHCNYFFGTPLACAASVGSVQMVEILLRHGARDISAGPLGISIAAIRGDHEIVRLLLESYERSLESQIEPPIYPKEYPWSRTPFAFVYSAAIQGGQDSIIEMLLASKFAENDDSTGWRFIPQAYACGHLDLWHRMEADPKKYRHSVPSEHLYTAPDDSAEGRDIRIVQHLLEKSPKAFIEISECVYLAAQRGRLEIVCLVGEQRKPSFIPRLALERAVRNGRLEVVRYLVSRFSADDIGDHNIGVALMDAIERGFDSIFRLIWSCIPQRVWHEPDDHVTGIFQELYAHAHEFRNQSAMQALQLLSVPYTERMTGDLAAGVEDYAKRREKSGCSVPYFAYQDFCSPFCPTGQFHPRASREDRFRRWTTKDMSKIHA